MSDMKRLSEIDPDSIWVAYEVGWWCDEEPKAIKRHIATIEAELASAKAECERLQKELDDARTELRRRLETVRHALDTSEDPLTVILAVLERMCGV